LFFILPYHKENLVAGGTVLDGVGKQIIDNHPDLFAGVVHDNLVGTAMEEIVDFLGFGNILITAMEVSQMTHNVAVYPVDLVAGLNLGDGKYFIDKEQQVF
jgi:hypothetical protein